MTRRLRSICLMMTVVGCFCRAVPLMGQGCSDAGMCTMGDMRAGVAANERQRSVHGALSCSIGIGDVGVLISSIVPEVSLPLFGDGTLRASLPLVRAHGSLGTNVGFGDASVNYSHRIYRRDGWEMALTTGVRIPTGTTDARMSDGRALPMPYQTGLGTTDVVIGVNTTMDRWTVTAGYQRVLVDRNNNTYEDDGLGYFTSDQLRRGDDAMLRAARRFVVEGIDLVPSVLAIYRVQGDRVMNRVVEGSDGLTLNLAVAASTRMTDDVDLRLDLASPLIIRKVRADGLTRSFVAALEIRYRW